MGVQFINDGEVKIYRPTGGGSTVNLISGSAGVGSPSEQFAIKADGSATFSGILMQQDLLSVVLQPDCRRNHVFCRYCTTRWHNYRY